MKFEASKQDYRQLENRIARWAAGQPGLLAGVIVGSRGRPGNASDEWSDLDLIVFAIDPAPYLKDSTWLAGFGELWASYLDATDSGYPEWFALYAGGLKVDFVFVQSPHDGNQTLGEMLADFTFQDVILRGVRVLFDKTGSQPEFPALSGSEALPPLPSEEQFSAAVGRFWIKAARAAKLARRGDLWRAKLACDGELKVCLLEMLEWHARSVYRPGQDTWYEGRYLNSWVYPPSLEALPATFALYDQADVRRALAATIDLYILLADETAASLECGYSASEQPALLDWLLSMLTDPDP